MWRKSGAASKMPSVMVLSSFPVFCDVQVGNCQVISNTKLVELGIPWVITKVCRHGLTMDAYTPFGTKFKRRVLLQSFVNLNYSIYIYILINKLSLGLPYSSSQQKETRVFSKRMGAAYLCNESTRRIPGIKEQQIWFDQTWHEWTIFQPMVTTAFWCCCFFETQWVPFQKLSHSGFQWFDLLFVSWWVSWIPGSFSILFMFGALECIVVYNVL